MALVCLLHILTVLFVIFLFRIINNLLGKLIIARRQFGLVRESRDHWREEARQTSGLRQERADLLDQIVGLQQELNRYREREEVCGWNHEL